VSVVSYPQILRRRREGELDEKTGRALWQVFVPAE